MPDTINHVNFDNCMNLNDEYQVVFEGGRNAFINLIIKYYVKIKMH